jgi:molybdopterin-guanine dinucleotide biosynthesis protein A
MGGGDKCLLDLEGKPLLRHAIDRLGPQVAGLVLNANGNPDRFADFGLPVVADSIEGFAGPLAGVLAGLDYAAGHGFERIVTAAADTPFLPDDLVDRLLAAAADSGTPMAMAATPDPEHSMSRHPTFALWPVSLREDLRQALTDGVRKVIAWTDRHGCASVTFATAPIDPFFNVNTPDDLARAKQMLRELPT